MASLALYWSIMVVCYLLASRLRRFAGRLGFVNTLLSISVYALVLVMGLRMGANREVTDSLGTIGAQALLVTALTMTFSMLGAYAVRKTLHINRHALPCGTADSTAERTSARADSSGTKTSLIIFTMVAAGMLFGYFFVPRVTDVDVFQAASESWLVVGLCLLLAFVGFSMGLEGKLTAMLRGASLGIVLVPLAVVLGTLLAGVAYSFLSPLTLRESLAVSAGFGWYSLAPSVISGAGYAVAGAVSFLHNVLRETLGIILIPLVASKVGYIEAVTLPGTAAMDVCLPIVEQSCNAEALPYSFTTGMASCLFSALLVPVIMGI